MGKSGKSQTIIFNGFYGSNTEILALKALAFLVFAADQDAYLNSGLFRLNKGGEGGVGGVGTNAVHGSSRRVSFSSAVLSDSPDNDDVLSLLLLPLFLLSLLLLLSVVKLSAKNNTSIVVATNFAPVLLLLLLEVLLVLLSKSLEVASVINKEGDQRRFVF